MADQTSELNQQPVDPKPADVQPAVVKPVDPLLEKVKAIVVEQLGVTADQVAPESKFIEDLNADSLDTVELIMALEEAFDIDVADEEAEKLLTVGDVTEYIRANAKL